MVMENESPTSTKKLGRPSNSTLLEKEGSRHEQKISNWLCKGSRKRLLDQESDSSFNSIGSPSKRASIVSTERAAHVTTDLHTTSTRNTAPQDKNFEMTTQTSASGTDVPEVNNQQRNVNTDIPERILMELSAIRRDINENAKKADAQFHLVQRSLEEQDKVWSTRWMEVNKRVDDLEARFLNSDEEQIGTRVTSIERSYADVAKCTAWIERADKESRKLNLLVKGLEVAGDNLLSEMNRFFETKFELKNKIMEARQISREKNVILVKTVDWASKLEILKNKGDRLKNQKIFIDRDLTEKERRIDYKAREFAKSERMKGRSVGMGYQKVRSDGVWFQWSEASNSFTEVIPNRPRTQLLEPKNQRTNAV